MGIYQIVDIVIDIVSSNILVSSESIATLQKLYVFMRLMCVFCCKKLKQ